MDCLGERVSRLKTDLQRFPERRLPNGEPVLEVGPVDIFHDVEQGAAVRRARIEGAHDISMIEAREDLALFPEAPRQVVVAAVVLELEFDRDEALVERSDGPLD